MLRRIMRPPAVADGRIDEKRTEIYYWWLLVAIVFEYARPGSFVSGINALRLNSLIPVSLFVMTLFAAGLRPFQQIFADRQARWLSGYIGLLAVSVPFAAVTLYAFDKFSLVVGYYFLFLIIARVATSPRRIRGVFAALAVAHLFLVFMNPAIITNTEVRTYIEGGTFLSDGNDFSLSLCILIPLTVELASSARSRIVGILAWVAILVMALAIIGSQSRGATLGIAAVAVFLWLFSRRKAATLVGIVVVGMVMMFHASGSYFDRMRSMNDLENEGSAQGRIMVWKASLRMAADHPLLGVGAGHFPVSFGTTYRPKEITGNIPWLTAHSTYFLVLGELGLPGLVAMLVLVIGGVRGNMAVRRQLLGSSKDPPSKEATEQARMLHLLSASVIGFAVAGAFLSASYYPHIFVLSGVLVAARSVAADEIRTKLEPADTTARPGRSRLRSGVKTARGPGTGTRRGSPLQTHEH